MAAPAGASCATQAAACPAGHGRRYSAELNILHRPDAVAERRQFGHWECDLIQFRKKFGKANVTSLVERVSRFAVFLRNNDRQSKPIMDGLIEVLQPLPTLLDARSPSTAAPSSANGRICKPASERRHGSATRSRPGRKARSRTPIAGFANGFRERWIPCRSATVS